MTEDEEQTTREHEAHRENTEKETESAATQRPRSKYLGKCVVNNSKTGV